MNSPWLWLLVVALVFAGAWWGGRLLEHSYAQAREVAGVLLLGACAIVPLVLMAHAGEDSALLHVTFAVALIGGLFADRRPTP